MKTNTKNRLSINDPMDSLGIKDKIRFKITHSSSIFLLLKNKQDKVINIKLKTGTIKLGISALW